MAEENGSPPASASADDTAAEQVPTSDRLMGLFGLAVALLIGAIAIDLITGGAVSRLLPARAAGDDG